MEYRRKATMATTMRTLDCEDGRAVPFAIDLPSSKYSNPLSAAQKALADMRAPMSEPSRCSTPGSDVSNVFTTPPSSTCWSTSTPQEIEPGESFDMRDEDIESCGKRPSIAPSIRSSGGSVKRAQSPGPRHESFAQPKSPLRQPVYPAYVDADDQDSDMTDSDCDEYEEEDDELEDDNDWSGDNDSLEATVIAAVDGDLGLAAYLIPLIHKDMSTSVRSKVESWQYNAAPGPGSSPSDNSHTTRSGSSQQSPSGSRKRRRSNPDNYDSRGNREGGDDDDRGASHHGGYPLPQDATQQTPLLACPFHKLDPSKYSQHGTSNTGKRHDFRACAGPGFKSIQRLKEHLKRKHYPVQCDRCYHIFPGTDRPACIEQLLKHRQLDVPCERRDAALREGISDAQWAALEKQNRKRNQETHKVEKWFEIWGILFPKADPPETPWYDGIVPRHTFSSPTGNRDAFGRLFLTVLDHKMRSGDIVLPTAGEQEQDTREKLKNAVLQTFTLFTSVHGPLSPTDTSSSLTGSNPFSSLVGGSSTHITRPANTPSQKMTATTVSTVPSTAGQAYTLNITNTPNPSGYTMVPMARRPSQFQNPMAAPLTHGPAMPPQVPMSNFASMPQQDLSNYCYVFSGQPWPPNNQYQPLPPTMFPTSGQINMGESDFYQPDNFGQGSPDADFGPIQ